MSKFTKQRRQEIVRDFAVRHNGHYNPRLFLEEVKREGEKHAAYDWFQWDTEKAAFAHHLEQAREFAQDLRVVFTVEAVGGAKNLKVKEAPMPLVISPMENRSTGGGYLLVDPKDPAYIAEQLKLFRSGERANNAMMHDIADRMSDSDIAAVADYAAGLR